MKGAFHHYEDKLLEFAYGELPDVESRAVDAHVKGCARCAQALASIRTVRAAMGQLEAAEPSDAGLESLLAYAEQAARRMAAGRPPKPTWWRKLMIPVLTGGLGAVVVVIGYHVSRKDFAAETAAQMRDEARAKAGFAQEDAPSAAEPVSVWTGQQAEAAADEGGNKEWSELRLNVREAAKLAPAEKKAERPPEIGAPGGPPKSLVAPKEQVSLKAKAMPGRKAAELAHAPPPADLPSNAGKPALREEVVAEREAAQVPQRRSSLGFGLNSSGEGARSPSSTYRGAPITRVAEPSDARPSQALAEAASQRDDGYDAEDRRKAAALEIEELLKAARSANGRGDRQTEIQYALEVYRRGGEATLYQRVESLKRLCDAYEALGLEAQAARYCNELVARYGDTAAARVVKDRRTHAQKKPAQPMDEAKKAEREAMPGEAPQAESH